MHTPRKHHFCPLYICVPGYFMIFHSVVYSEVKLASFGLTLETLSESCEGDPCYLTLT